MLWVRLGTLRAAATMLPTGKVRDLDKLAAARAVECSRDRVRASSPASRLTLGPVASGSSFAGTIETIETNRDRDRRRGRSAPWRAVRASPPRIRGPRHHERQEALRLDEHPASRRRSCCSCRSATIPRRDLSRGKVASLVPAMSPALFAATLQIPAFLAPLEASRVLPHFYQ